LDTPRKITFRFEKDEDYRLIPVNGVWGGATPRGDILVDLFHESSTLPEVVTHAMAPGGQLGEEVQRTPTGEIQRKVLVGMVLTAEQAESIGRWLLETARKVRERTLANGGGDSERDTPTTH
jgi:hypothetical protein